MGVVYDWFLITRKLLLPIADCAGVGYVHLAGDPIVPMKFSLDVDGSVSGIHKLICCFVLFILVKKPPLLLPPLSKATLVLAGPLGIKRERFAECWSPDSELVDASLLTLLLVVELLLDWYPIDSKDCLVDNCSE